MLQNNSTQGQGQQTTAKRKDEDSQLDNASLESKSSSGSSVSTVSLPTVVPKQIRRGSMATADVARLFSAFAKGHRIISYDTCAGDTNESGMRQKLNESIYELMVARAATIESEEGGEALRMSTSETPFVRPPFTGDDSVDAFISERTARVDEDGIGFDGFDGGDDVDDKDGSWQKSQAWRRGLAILVVVFFLLALFHFVGGVYLLQSTEVFEHPYACKTKNCLHLSAWLQEGVDNKTNPCDNFYNFSCGNYKLHRNIKRGGFRRIVQDIPFEYISNKALGRLLHRVHDYPLNQILPFYQSCINEHERDRVGYQPLVDLLFQLKLMDPVRSAQMDIARTIIRIYRKVNKRVFVDIYSARENFVVLSLVQPENEFTFGPNLVDYPDCIRNIFTLLKTDLNIVDDDEIETIVYLLVHFEAELVYIQSRRTIKILGFPDDMQNFVKPPKQLHPNYIPSQTGYFKFASVVAALFSHQRQLQNVTIFFNPILSILKQDQRLDLLILFEFLNRTPTYVLMRYFQWTLIKHFRVDLTTRILDLIIPVFRDIGYTPDERCFRSMFTRLHVLSALRFSREIQNLNFFDKRADEILENIWEVLKNLTKTPTGLYSSFKETFSTLSIVGTATAEFEPYVKTFYEGLDLNKNKYFENLVQTMSIKAENDLKKFQNIPPFHRWPVGYYSVDEVILNIMENSNRLLYIPFGALQDPFMGNDIPILDMAGLGFYVGAFYMMHYAIADLFAMTEKEREVAEPETYVIEQKQFEMEVLPRFECIADDYRRVIAHMQVEKKAEPTVAFGRVKNFAYVAAFELLVETITQFPSLTHTESKNQVLLGFEKYSSEQLFFMAMARHTCKSFTPERKVGIFKRGSLLLNYMVNTAFRNSEYFAKVWSCSPRRFMNPRRKCKFFCKKKPDLPLQGQSLPTTNVSKNN